ncbi:MAG: DUF3078 domain-containing protein, partial [Odoribacter sp.]|nr:DUF3078 domain-containing protein [Odoribacter sp.]
MRILLFIFCFTILGIEFILAQEIGILPLPMYHVKTLASPPLSTPPIYYPKDISYLKKEIIGKNIESPGVRYAVQHLNNISLPDKDLQNAIHVLSDYVLNDTAQEALEYLKEYVKYTYEKEQALDRINEVLESDTVEISSSNFRLPYDIKRDIRTMQQYINNDPNYTWLKKISGDSVLLEIYNANNQSISFWMNNEKERYYRFWALNRQRDTIGTWLHILPGGTRLRLLFDEGVYQEQQEVQTRRKYGDVLENKPVFNLHEVVIDKLKRRYWTYHTQMEGALGQGFQANWSGGGENSFSLLTNTRFFANYNKSKVSWENYVYYCLGFLKSGKQEIRKNEDKLELNSKLGYSAFKNWYYTVQLNIQTNIFNSYNYPNEDEKILIGNFMSPGYFTLSLGMDYKPNKNFSLYLSPIAGNWTWVRDTNKIDQTRYGVETGKKSKGDAGARVELRHTFKLFDFMSFRNELVMFSSY